MDLTSLPDDALLGVLRYLGTKELLQCRGVCRRLRDAALHPDIWRKRSLSFSWKDDDGVQLVSAVLRLAPCLGKLTLHKGFHPEVLKALLASTSCAISELDVNLKYLDAAQVAVALARQAALGRLKSVSLTLNKTTRKERMLLDKLLHTQGLTSLFLLMDYPDSVDCQWGPSGDAMPSSLQRFEYAWPGRDGPPSSLSSLLQWHADTLQVVHLIPRDCYICAWKLPAGTAALLAALPNLRELKCPVLEDMPALLQCPALETLYLVVTDWNDSTPPLLRGVQQYLSQADRLETLTLKYLAEDQASGGGGICSDDAVNLVSSLAGPGSGAPSALRSLKLTYYEAGDFLEPQPQLEPLAAVLPRLENLVSLDLGGPYTEDFFEAMDGQVLPRLERLRVNWLPMSEGCPHVWAYSREACGLLMRYPRLHLELDSYRCIDSFRACGNCHEANILGVEDGKVYTLYIEHDGQCQQEHAEDDIRILVL